MAFAWLWIFAIVLECCTGLSFPTAKRLPVVSPPAQLEVTNNTIQLERTTLAPGTGSWTHAISRARLLSGRFTDLDSTDNTTELTEVWIGSSFLAPITIGNQSFTLIADTGSSDTWVVLSNFSCVSPSDQVQPRSRCHFASYFTPDNTTNVIANENFNITYASGEWCTGSMAQENVTLANIDVPQQEIALIDHASWYGDDISSGLMGLAYPRLTAAYHGTDPATDTFSNRAQYSPVMTSIFAQNLAPPVFSLALFRPVSNFDESEVGGYLSIGGIPDIPHDPYFASTPLLSETYTDGSPSGVYDFYSIILDGFAISASPYVQFDMLATQNPLKEPLIGNRTQCIVDSGTTLLYAPADVAARVAAAFDPPATWSDSQQGYMVSCSATAPLFGVAIGGKVFFVNSQDLVSYQQISDDGSEDVCMSGVQPWAGGGTNVLGDVFLRNVLAVFDVGAAEMRFSAREQSTFPPMP